MKVDATFGLLGDGTTAVIEMAAASGLHWLKPEQYDPMKTTTFGTGELIMAAAMEGAKRIILGIGGSATVDGGIGCAQACGVEFDMSDGTIRMVNGPPLIGGDLPNVRKSRPSIALMVAEIVNQGTIQVACDVNNPLYGPNGAARVFGPQKGANAVQVEILDRALFELANRHAAQNLAAQSGAGAAGGLGFGMMQFLRATLAPGFGLVASAVGLRERIAGADLVITGEGRLDASSLGGKTAIGVARLCKELGVPCVALVGAVGEGAEHILAEGITQYVAIGDRPMTLAEAVARAPELLQLAAERLMRNWRPNG